MAKTRLLQPQTPKSTVTPVDWNQLLRKAINMAEAAGDSRAVALRNSISSGQASQTLKKMGIIGENDLLREFPTPTR